MLITFVKSIQVQAYRTDGTSWTTRMDAAYGEFRDFPRGDWKGAVDGLGMVHFLLYEGVQNDRDGRNSKFGLNKLLPNVAEVMQAPLPWKNPKRNRLLDNWNTIPPHERWMPVEAAIRVDNIRGVVGA